MPIGRTICLTCGDHLENVWGYCNPCFYEKRVIQNQCRLARKLGLPADLTQTQWREIVKKFNGMCAYCLDRQYEFVEHYIPLTLGGGTTITNIVPACRACNDRKRNKHPNDVTRIPREAMERVHQYLESLKTDTLNS